jgi:hypothetical protein
MPVARLLAIVLLACTAILSAQVQNRSTFPAGPTVDNKAANKAAGQTQREPWQIIPDLTSEPLLEQAIPQTPPRGRLSLVHE